MPAGVPRGPRLGGARVGDVFSTSFQGKCALIRVGLGPRNLSASVRWCLSAGRSLRRVDSRARRGTNVRRRPPQPLASGPHETPVRGPARSRTYNSPPRGTGVSVTRRSPKPQREVRLLGPPSDSIPRQRGASGIMQSRIMAACRLAQVRMDPPESAPIDVVRSLFGHSKEGADPSRPCPLRWRERPVGSKPGQI